MRTPTIPLLLAAALSLTGCVSVREVPAPISDADLQSYLEDRVDAAWLNSGLDGIVERPEADPSTYVENYRSPDSNRVMSECLADAGIEAWGMSEGNGGPVFTTGTGGVPANAELLTLYSCYAASPSDFGRLILSEAEFDYLYDYYRDWVMPCLRLNGYEISEVPTRAAYTTEMQWWIPYYSIIDGPGMSAPLGFSQEQLDAAVAQCGAPYGGLPYNELYGF